MPGDLMERIEICDFSVKSIQRTGNFDAQEES